MPGPVYTVEAYSFASRFVLRDVEGWLPQGVDCVRSKTQILVRWSDSQVAYAFDFGAIAFFNVPEPMRVALLDAFSKNLPREPHPPLRETVLVEVVPGAAVSADFERVVVPELTPTSIEVVALVLCQSVALDYYDEDVQQILDRIGAIADEIAQQGRPRGRTKVLTRFVGTAIASQVEIISAISLLDKPDITWENEYADRLHDKIRYNFEISERYKALESKLSTIREALSAFLELSSTRSAFWLEAAIVALIVLEIVLSFVRPH